MVLSFLEVRTPVQILEMMPMDEVREIVESGWVSTEDIITRLDELDHDFIANTVKINDGNDPVVAKCRHCGKISAARMGDFGWGCTCSRNPRGTSAAAAGSKPNLFVDSQAKALVWWDHENNDEADFRTVTVRATRTFHWVCPECGHSFEANVNDMTRWLKCPRCAEVRHEQWSQQYEQWKTTPVAAVPELLAAWADEDDPQEVMVAGHRLRRFRCPAGHHPRVTPTTFLHSGCPSCRGAKTRAAPDKKWLADTLPEIASQWHPTKNGNYTPHSVVWDSQRTVWWRADCCGNEWPETPRARDKYARWRCPECRTILGSLAWHDPGLAAEWSPANPKTAWQVRPTANTEFTPVWICATAPTHVWQAPLAGRSKGAECPECRQAGKSRVELDHHAAAAEMFGAARSGAVLRHEAFTTRKSWTVDISATVGDTSVVIEYDGAYWHSAEAKVLVDQSKSADLLAAGYALVRLREDELPSLEIDHPRYSEIRVYSKAPRPQKIMAQVRDWLADVDHQDGAGSGSADRGSQV
ncbi:zinc-ribbon domain-containing protein [Kocuria rosea]|nr:zinc-ribbon domain-containing protein [Kocuria rosea]